MTTILNPYPKCKRDGFPMVKIGKKQQCAAEYLDRCIGQKKIVDVAQEDEITYLVFENGYELPMLCFCCAKPLEVKDLDKLHRKMRTRRLESMSVGTIPASEGGEFLEFVLEFSKKGLESQGLVQSLAPEAAAQMKRPERNKSRKCVSQNKGTRHQKKQRGFG